MSLYVSNITDEIIKVNAVQSVYVMDIDLAFAS